MILCGFQGVGKSRFGKALAERVGAHWIDTDALILERCLKSSCKDAVKAYGEEGFRKLEREAVADLLGVQGAVIALGGGTLEDERMVPLVRSLGLIVYLEASFETLLERTRLPLARFYARRKKTFAQVAEHTLLTEGKTDDQIVETLVKIWETVSERSLKL